MKNASLQLSPIVAGTMSYGQHGKSLTPQQIASLISFCVELGMTSFDMAEIYGSYTTEELFGRSWKQVHIPREKVQFISKTGIKVPQSTRPEYGVKHYDTSFEHIIWSAENSLKNIGTDYLDLILVHRPDPLMHPDEIAEAFEKLKKEGKVKHVGVSNFTTSQFDMLNRRIALETNQIEFSLLHQQPIFDGTLDRCIQHNIPPMIWSPLGGGREAQPEFQGLLEKIAAKHQVETAQIFMAWIMQHPAKAIPVVGTTNPERINKAWESQQIKLSREEWFLLHQTALGQEIP